jgi:hypothetical protein
MAEDLRYVDRKGNRVSWLTTAHDYFNTWLYPAEIEALHGAATEEEAERLVRDADTKAKQRLETWRYYQ